MRPWSFVVCLVVGCASSSSPDPTPITTNDATVPLDTSTVEAALDTVAPEVSPEVSPETGADASCTLKKPYSSKNAVCNGCAQSKCCAQVNGCLGDLRCDDDYVNCILACALFPEDGSTDAGACLADCASKYPEGKKLYDTAIGCVDAACKAECG